MVSGREIEMALSAQERRQWKELERQLVAGSAQGGLPVGDSRSAQDVARNAGTVLVLVMVLVAFMIVILAVVVKILLIGVLGFILMIIGGTEFHFPSSTKRAANLPGKTPWGAS